MSFISYNKCFIVVGEGANGETVLVWGQGADGSSLQVFLKIKCL